MNMIRKIFNLQNLATLSIWAMPLYVVRWSFFGVPTNLFEILALITIGLFLKGSVGLENRLREQKEYFIPIVMLICGLLLSIACSESYRNGLGILKGWFVVPIIFSWVCVQIFEDKNDMLRAIYGSALVVACFSLMYYLAGKLTFDGRLEAFYNSPNFLAMYLAPAIIIGVYFFKEQPKFYLLSLALINFSFYQTKSYAAWVAVFVALMFLVIMQSKKAIYRWKKLLILIFLVGAVFFLQKGTDKLDSLLNFKERSSAYSRGMIWRSAVKIGLDNPIFGIGPGNFQNKYLEYQKYFPPYLEWAVPQPHNLFLALWLQSGLVGLVGFLWLIFLWGKEFIKISKWRNEDFILFGIISYMLLHGIVDTTYFKNDLAVIFWLIIFSTKNTLCSQRVFNGKPQLLLLSLLRRKA
jgi:O-antigen ligase